MHNKIQIEVLVESSKNCSRSRIVASPYYRMKILVAAASDRANAVFIIPLQPCSHIVYSFTRLPPPHYNVCHKLVTSLSQPCHNLATTKCLYIYIHWKKSLLQISGKKNNVSWEFLVLEE